MHFRILDDLLGLALSYLYGGILSLQAQMTRRHCL